MIQTNDKTPLFYLIAIFIYAYGRIEHFLDIPIWTNELRLGLMR